MSGPGNPIVASQQPSLLLCGLVPLGGFLFCWQPALWEREARSGNLGHPSLCLALSVGSLPFQREEMPEDRMVISLAGTSEWWWSGNPNYCGVMSWSVMPCFRLSSPGNGWALWVTAVMCVTPAPRHQDLQIGFPWLLPCRSSISIVAWTCDAHLSLGFWAGRQIVLFY